MTPLLRRIGYWLRGRRAADELDEELQFHREMVEQDMRRDGVSAQDYKSALQELVQGRNRPLPEYRVVGAIGPDHQKLFDVEVLVAGEPLARATGPSKKEAEQEAARLALGRLTTDH